MTQEELEQSARKMRARGLHYSWLELMEFTGDVVGNLADAYQALLKGISSLSKDLDDTDTEIKMITDKLATALTILTSEEKVTRWRNDALLASDMSNTTRLTN